MSAIASTDWGPALEDALFLTVAHRHVPGLPARRATPPRGPETPAEVQALCDDWVRTAAHDLFIVQAVSRAMHTVFADDPHVQLLLSRQLGDDGDHAVEARRHLWALRGSDPLPEIQRHLAEHWARAGDIPFRSVAGFLAFEFHYELYILARMQIVRRTARIADTAMKDFAESRIRPDEAFHRSQIVGWWLDTLQAMGLEERARFTREILVEDEALQQRLNPFLREELADMARVYGADLAEAHAIYDDWRRTLLAKLLDTDASALGALTSIVH